MFGSITEHVTILDLKLFNHSMHALYFTGCLFLSSTGWTRNIKHLCWYDNTVLLYNMYKVWCGVWQILPRLGPSYGPKLSKYLTSRVPQMAIFLPKVFRGHVLRPLKLGVSQNLEFLPELYSVYSSTKMVKQRIPVV